MQTHTTGTFPLHTVFVHKSIGNPQLLKTIVFRHQTTSTDLSLAYFFIYFFECSVGLVRNQGSVHHTFISAVSITDIKTSNLSELRFPLVWPTPFTR